MPGREDSGSDRTVTAGAKRRSRKGLPPPSAETLGALAGASPEQSAKKAKRKESLAKVPSKKRTRSLNFQVTPEFRRAFKQAAAARDCKKVELLERMFEEWEAREAG